MFAKHEAVVTWAKSQKGICEHPDGSNSGKEVQFFQSHTWLPGTGWPWCAAFVCTAWEVGGGRALPWRDPSAWDMGNRARASGWTVQSVGLMEPGDIVVWGFGEGHVSLFLAYDKATDLVHTIDGNVGNCVDYRVRPLSQVRNLIHVPEVAKPVPPKTQKAPIFQVVTGENERVVYVSGARAVGKHLARILLRHPEGITIRRKRRVG